MSDFLLRIHHKRSSASSASPSVPDLTGGYPYIQSSRIAAGRNWWTTLSNERDLKLDINQIGDDPGRAVN